MRSIVTVPQSHKTREHPYGHTGSSCVWHCNAGSRAVFFWTSSFGRTTWPRRAMTYSSISAQLNAPGCAASTRARKSRSTWWPTADPESPRQAICGWSDRAKLHRSWRAVPRLHIRRGISFHSVRRARSALASESTKISVRFLRWCGEAATLGSGS